MDDPPPDGNGNVDGQPGEDGGLQILAAELGLQGNVVTQVPSTPQSLQAASESTPQSMNAHSESTPQYTNADEEENEATECELQDEEAADRSNGDDDLTDNVAQEEEVNGCRDDGNVGNPNNDQAADRSNGEGENVDSQKAGEESPPNDVDAAEEDVEEGPKEGAPKDDDVQEDVVGAQKEAAPIDDGDVGEGLKEDIGQELKEDEEVAATRPPTGTVVGPLVLEPSIQPPPFRDVFYSEQHTRRYIQNGVTFKASPQALACIRHLADCYTECWEEHRTDNVPFALKPHMIEWFENTPFQQLTGGSFFKDFKELYVDSGLYENSTHPEWIHNWNPNCQIPCYDENHDLVDISDVIDKKYPAYFPLMKQLRVSICRKCKQKDPKACHLVDPVDLVGVALEVFDDIAEGLKLPEDPYNSEQDDNNSTYSDQGSLFDHNLYPQDSETPSSLMDEYESYKEEFSDYSTKHYHLCCLLYLKAVESELLDKTAPLYKPEDRDVYTTQGRYFTNVNIDEDQAVSFLWICSPTLVLHCNAHILFFRDSMGIIQRDSP